MQRTIEATSSRSVDVAKYADKDAAVKLSSCRATPIASGNAVSVGVPQPVLKSRQRTLGKVEKVVCVQHMIILNLGKKRSLSYC